ncbi:MULTISPECIES: DsrE family protein [Enterococcus]|uniref:DsrE family protein n=1 Tax=Enterococcus alishanensis TaxID=1303817 RepID=A0ABS6TCS2_9ENTE|nr:DsrE family protein [Enterococcus alishanensis]MBV7390710.1 DsrE family protein [Enterococcus alishanensis]
MKVVFHVDELEKLRQARHSIESLLLDEPKCQVILVINGEAIQGYLLPKMTKFIKEYPNVEFHACHKSMRGFQVRTKQLSEKIKVVPAGITDLVRLQAEGAHYIKC